MLVDSLEVAQHPLHERPWPCSENVRAAQQAPIGQHRHHLRGLHPDGASQLLGSCVCGQQSAAAGVDKHHRIRPLVVCGRQQEVPRQVESPDAESALAGHQLPQQAQQDRATRATLQDRVEAAAVCTGSLVRWKASEPLQPVQRIIYRLHDLKWCGLAGKCFLYILCQLLHLVPARLFIQRGVGVFGYKQRTLLQIQVFVTELHVLPEGLQSLQLPGALQQLLSEQLVGGAAPCGRPVGVVAGWLGSCTGLGAAE
mmetsp:Transcript_21177/g.63732  ORF Transcript_21177/g.63732 Transcript_21177/m.63732 type:complete len:255 (-) Transcript_21177:979-1743(-)